LTLRRPFAWDEPVWRARTAIAVTVLALVPAIVAVAALAGRRWIPLPDTSIINVRVRDVFGGDIPLVGAYSRYGWNHPGPLLFYALAPLNALAGGATWGTLVSASVLQGIAIALAARLAWRRGGLGLVLLVLAAMEWTAVAVGPQLFVDPWNPNPPVLFLGLFILQLWSIALDEPRQIVGAVVVGSFLIQCHVGYAPLVVAGLAWALVAWLLGRRVERAGRAAWRRPVVVATTVGVLLWLPTLVEELTSNPGNLTLLARWTDRGEPTLGLHGATQLLAAEFRPLPPWLGGNVHRIPSNPLAGGLGFADPIWLVVPAMLLIATALVARRRQARDLLHLVILMAVIGVASLVALAQTAFPTFEYVYQWKALVAAFVVAVAAWGLLAAVRGHTPPRLLAIGGAMGVVVIGWAAVNTSVDVAADPGLNAFQSATSALVTDAARHGLPRQPFLVRDSGSDISLLFYGVVDELDRIGAPVRVDRAFAREFGDQRVASRRDVSAIWIVAEDGSAISRLTALPGSRVVARTTPLPLAQERQLVHLQHTLGDELERAGRADLEPLLQGSDAYSTLFQIEALNRTDLRLLRQLLHTVVIRGGGRFAIVAFDPQAAPAYHAPPATSPGYTP